MVGILPISYQCAKMAPVCLLVCHLPHQFLNICLFGNHSISVFLLILICCVDAIILYDRQALLDIKGLLENQPRANMALVNARSVSIKTFILNDFFLQATIWTSFFKLRPGLEQVSHPCLVHFVL